MSDLQNWFVDSKNTHQELRDVTGQQLKRK